MTNFENVTMLDSAAIAAIGRVQIENWTAEYDLRADVFTLTVYWQGYGYGQQIPTASVASVIAIFEAASRARAAVFYDGHSGNLKWSIGPVPV